MDVSNLKSVEQFKYDYIEQLGDAGTDLTPQKIRMFAMGKELKDDLFLYSYDIMNESTVQAMIRK